MSKNVSGILAGVATVMVGVFAAGYVMNMLRDNSIVNESISGFDA